MGTTGAFGGNSCVARVSVAHAIVHAIREVAGQDALNAALSNQVAGACSVITHVLNPCFTRMANRVWQDAEEARKCEWLRLVGWLAGWPRLAVVAEVGWLRLAWLAG